MAPRFDKLLVLDLDETLIHSCYVQEESRPERSPDHYLDLGDILTWERPGLRAFMDWCLDSFAGVGIWTVGTRSYAAELVPLICDAERLAFMYGRNRCTRKRNLDTWTEYWIKDIRKLRKLGFPRTKILCVDDSPSNFERSFGNYIYMPPFTGDPGDDLLPKLQEYLETVAQEPNVRTVEKRGWYRNFTKS